VASEAAGSPPPGPDPMAVGDPSGAISEQERSAVIRGLLRDPVTQLPNLILLEDRIEQAIHRARRDRAPLALLLASVLSPGQEEAAIADQVLTEAARRLSEALRNSDVVACIGRGCFAVLLTTSVTESGIKVVVDKIRRVLGLPFEVSGDLMLVNTTISLALWPADGEDAQSLLSVATDGLRRSARLHPNSPPAGPAWSPTPLEPTLNSEADTGDSQTLDSAGNGRSSYESAVENQGSQPGAASDSAHFGLIMPPHSAFREIERAITEGELLLHYLPKISLTDGDVVSMEALVRWQHPVKGLLPPSSFLPAISDSELGWEVTRWVLDTAMDQCADWLTSGLALAVSVNVSRYDVTVAPLIDAVQDALRRTHLLGRHLTLEISEQAVVDELVRASAALVILRTEGVRISIDDCGGRRVAPLYLARMPIDEIKVDNRLIADEDPADLELLGEIVRLGHSFGIKITAEAVEEEGRAAGLEKLGIDSLQGFHVAGPLQAQNVPTWVANYRARTDNLHNVVWTG